MTFPDEIFVYDDDPEIIQDYCDAFDEKYLQINQILTQWEQDPQNKEYLHKLFRLLHTIKGDATMCFLVPISELAHALEDVASSVRDKKISFTSRLYEVILLTMDRLSLMSAEVVTSSKISPYNHNEVIQALEKLAAIDGDEDLLIAETINALTASAGEHSGYTEEIEEKVASPQVIGQSECSELQHSALTFAKEFDQRLEDRVTHWKGRTEFILPIAVGINAMAMHPVDVLQLEMAVYLHDFGMMLLPESIVSKRGKLTDKEFVQLKEHPAISAKLVAQMPGWEDAKTIVEQHHEKIDGQGYPNNIDGDNIHPGAKIVAICDAFYAMTHDRPDKISKRSLLRAVTEINACTNTQFCPEFVKIFNAVVKIQHSAGAFDMA